MTTAAARSRADLAAEAARLYSGGLTRREVGARLGISRSYAAELLTDPERAKVKARRERYRGTCEVCGAETHYGGHKTDASPLCVQCGRKQAGRTRQGTGPFQRALYSVLAKQPRVYTEIRLALGLERGDLSARLNRELKAGRIVRVSRGVYALPQTERAAA